MSRIEPDNVHTHQINIPNDIAEKLEESRKNSEFADIPPNERVFNSEDTNMIYKNSQLSHYIAHLVKNHVSSKGGD